MFKSHIIVLCLIVCLLASFSAVNATDMNDTQYSVENNDLLAIGSLNENLTVNNQVDEIIGIENSEILSEGEGTFTELKELLENPSDVNIILNKNYIFSSGDRNERILIKNDSLTINGNNHIIDAQSLSSIFEITGNNVVLKNTIIQNGYAKDPKYIPVNGAAIIWNGKNGAIDNCQFINNTIVGYIDYCYGGAIYWRGENATIKNSKFVNNAILNFGHGGAVFFSGLCQQVYIYKSNFESNAARHAGGAVYIQDTNTIIDSCTFKNNNAEIQEGGAIYYENSYEKNVLIEESEFRYNTANVQNSNMGGAIATKNSENSTVSKCKFWGTNPIYLSSSKSGDAFINLSGNEEKTNIKGHIVYNNARLWLENNNFQTTIYNTGLILSHVTSEVRDPSTTGSGIHYWNAPDKFLYRVYIYDDNTNSKNEIVNEEITILDTKEGLIKADNNFTYTNYYNEYMWFVGVHNLSVIWDTDYFFNMTNDTNVYRVSGSYAHLQYLVNNYEKAWDYKEGDNIILESPISFDPVFDLNNNKYKMSDYEINLYTPIKGSRWQTGGKVTINGMGIAKGFYILRDDLYVDNIIFSYFKNIYLADCARSWWWYMGSPVFIETCRIF